MIIITLLTVISCTFKYIQSTMVRSNQAAFDVLSKSAGCLQTSPADGSNGTMVRHRL